MSLRDWVNPDCGEPQLYRDVRKAIEDLKKYDPYSWRGGLPTVYFVPLSMYEESITGLAYLNGYITYQEYESRYSFWRCLKRIEARMKQVDRANRG